MFNGWQTLFGDKGFQLVLAVGEDNQGGQASWQYAQQYKESHSYGADVIAVASPGWQQLGQAINHGGSTIGLPFMILFDQAMIIVDINAAMAEVPTKIGEMLGVEIEASCSDSCGGQSIAGCYCDDACSSYGDCCPDACDVCGVDCP